MILKKTNSGFFACEIRDPYWENSTAMYLSSLIAYVPEALPAEEHTLASADNCDHWLYLGGQDVELFLSGRGAPVFPLP